MDSREPTNLEELRTRYKLGIKIDKIGFKSSSKTSVHICSFILTYEIKACMVFFGYFYPPN